MKFEELSIIGLPKSFDLFDLPEYIEPNIATMDPDDIQYDMYPAECDESHGEDAGIVFKYDESSTGVEIFHDKIMQILSFWLSPWASIADVMLYSDVINAILKKHKKACLYEGNKRITSIEGSDVLDMLRERREFLKTQLTTKEGFTMEGINTSYTLKVAHLAPETTVDVQAEKLMKTFVNLQWENNEDEL